MSYQTPDPIASLSGSLQRSGCPVTLWIIVVSTVLFLIDFFSGGLITGLLACRIASTSLMPIWSPITYAIVHGKDFISLVFSGMWFWFIGGSLERSWGAQRFAVYAGVMSILTALCVWLGCALRHEDYMLFGPWMPLSALTVSWATLNPRVTVNLYGLIPIPAWAIAAFEVCLVYFVYLAGDPFLGLFGLIPSALGFWYVQSGLSAGYFYQGYRRRGPDLRMTSTNRPLDGSSGSKFSISNWLRDRAEKRRLRKLLRNSGYSDKDFRR